MTMSTLSVNTTDTTSIWPNAYTVEPLNNGHVGDEHFVHCSEVVPSSEVEMYGQYKGRGQTVCPLQGGCPLFRVSIIGGSTVILKFW